MGFFVRIVGFFGRKVGEKFRVLVFFGRVLATLVFGLKIGV